MRGGEEKPSEGRVGGVTDRITPPQGSAVFILPETQRPRSRGFKPKNQNKIKGKEFLEKGTVKSRKAELSGGEGHRETGGGRKKEEEEGEEGEQKTEKEEGEERERGKNMALASCMCKIRKELQ